MAGRGAEPRRRAMGAPSVARWFPRADLASMSAGLGLIWDRPIDPIHALAGILRAGSAPTDRTSSSVGPIWWPNSHPMHIWTTGTDQSSWSGMATATSPQMSRPGSPMVPRISQIGTRTREPLPCDWRSARWPSGVQPCGGPGARALGREGRPADDDGAPPSRCRRSEGSARPATRAESTRTAMSVSPSDGVVDDACGDGAGDEVRTRDMQLGRLPLCQLSYSRLWKV